MRAFASACCGVVLATAVARAESVQPLLPPADTGSEGVMTKYIVRATLGEELATVPGATAAVSSAQLLLGPTQGKFAVSEELRVRLTAIHTSDDSYENGPMTISYLHFVPVQKVFIVPLLALQVGFEGAISTPWLSSRTLKPAEALTALGIDGELAGNGWSLRPRAFLRVDFVGCRNEYLELGASPEVFLPTSGPDEVAVRYNAAVGFSFLCGDRENPPWPRPGFVLEYRARGVAYAGAVDPHYNDLLSLGLQASWHGVTLGAYAGYDPLCSTDRHIFGLRLQLGVGRAR